MNQKELFHTDEYDALRDDVKAVGIKEIAALLKPDCDIENAAKWVSNCLDRKRDQKFEPQHYTIIVNEARKVGSFAYVTYLLRETWFEPPVAKVYDSEVLKVGDRIGEILKQADEFVHYLGKLKEQVKK